MVEHKTNTKERKTISIQHQQQYEFKRRDSELACSLLVCFSLSLRLLFCV